MLSRCGLEMQSLALYAVAAINRDLSVNGAGLKYFVLGALSSGMPFTVLALYMALRPMLALKKSPSFLR